MDVKPIIWLLSKCTSIKKFNSNPTALEIHAHPQLREYIMSGI